MNDLIVLFGDQYNLLLVYKQLIVSVCGVAISSVQWINASSKCSLARDAYVFPDQEGYPLWLLLVVYSLRLPEQSPHNVYSIQHILL